MILLGVDTGYAIVGLGAVNTAAQSFASSSTAR
jgi:hypothetical protein